MIAIKKQRKQQAGEKPPISLVKDEPKNLSGWKSRVAEEYVRENFVVWSSVRYDGGFRSEGVAIWEFLRKYVYEWSEEKRREYVSSLELVQEASKEFEKKARDWQDRVYREWIFTRPMDERMKIPRLL